MDWSLSKLRRIEGGEVTITTNDLRALLTLYDLDPLRTEQLIGAARKIRQAKVSRKPR